MIKAVLFDLDGTLLDTAADLGKAINSLLLEYKRTPFDAQTVRTTAGMGAKAWIKMGFNIDESDPLYAELIQKLLAYYQLFLKETTKFFLGMEEVLAYLAKNNIPWGIVTNKPEKFTQQHVANLDLLKNAVCVISGDTLSKCKPDPEPVIHACKLLKTAPENCLFVGDSIVDIQASNAAGAVSLAALYGYIPSTEDPLTWGAKGYIKDPLEILDWIKFEK